MKIHFLVANNDFGGVNRVARELTNALSERGHEVKVSIPLIPYWYHDKLVRMNNLNLLQKLRFIIGSLKYNLYQEVAKKKLKWVVAQYNIHIQTVGV